MNNFVLKRNDKCQFLIGTVFTHKRRCKVKNRRLTCQFLIGTVFLGAVSLNLPMILAKSVSIPYRYCIHIKVVFKRCTYT